MSTSKSQSRSLSDQDVAALRHALIAPDSVALIGASDRADKLTARPMTFLTRHGYRGAIFPVNPARDTVMGMKSYARVVDIGQPVDHAYILLDTDAAMAAFDDCVEAGVKVVSMLANGFAEAGEEGQRRQQQLVERAQQAGICLIGPNSMGIVDTHSRFVCTTNAAFAAPTLATGRFGVISQSGSLIGTILSRGQARGLSYSTLISVGNEAQYGVGNIGCILVDDDRFNGFLLFLETIRDADAIQEFAQRANVLNKPVVAYRIGRSDEGQALSVSHTGALTGSTQAADSFLDYHGIHRVNNFESLMEAPIALRNAAVQRTRPQAVTVVSTTGGGGAMVVDQLSLRGVTVQEPSPATRGLLSRLGIQAGHGKLIDVTLAGARTDVMAQLLKHLVSEPDVGIVLVAIGSSAQFNPEVAVGPVINTARELDADQNALLMAFPLPQADESLTLLAAHEIPAFRNVESCAETIALIFQKQKRQNQKNKYQKNRNQTNKYQKNRNQTRTRQQQTTIEDIPESVSELLSVQTNNVIHEWDAARIFNLLGVASPEQTLFPADTQDIDAPGYPCVVKLVSNDIPHKSDAGAIQTGIRSHEELINALALIRSNVQAVRPEATIEGVLVQTMETGVAETLIGISRDPVVGPVITIAFGGVVTEIFKDICVLPAPVSREDAARMIKSLKSYPLLDGYRGSAKADTPALAAAIASFSRLALIESISEAEINPLLVRKTGQGVVMLDALIRCH